MKRLYCLLTIFLLAIGSGAQDEIVSFKLSSRNGLPDNNIRSIKQDSLGLMYFKSLYATYRYDGYTFEKLTPHEALLIDTTLSQHLKSVTVGSSLDNRGNRYTVSKEGMLTYEDQASGGVLTFRIFEPHILKQSDNLKVRVLTDRQGLVWVSVNGNGLFVCNRTNGQIRHITDNDPSQLIDNNYIVYLKEDMAGNIWVSQEHHGLACLTVRPRNYDILSLHGPNSHHGSVRMLKRISSDTVLIADNYGSLYRSNGNLQNLTTLSQGQDNFLSAHCDRKGRLWLGSRLRGVNIDGQWFGKSRVDCIESDYRDRIWLCGIKGHLLQASLSDNGTYEERHFLTGISNLSPRVLTGSADRKSFWLGAKGGLYYFNTDSLLADSTAIRRVADVAVQSLMLDSVGRLWIGTKGQGLAVMENADRIPSGALRFLSTSDGLPNDVVQMIGSDGNGHICVGTEDGMAFYDPESRRFASSHYFNDRLTRNFYTEGGIIRLNDGRVAMATLDGIVIVRFSKDTAPVTADQVMLTGLTVNGVRMPLDSLLAADGRLTLSHDQNTLSLRFSNLAYGWQQQTFYSYLLEGYDRHWSIPAHQNEAVYKYLPPGYYTLRVKARKGSDNWGEEYVVGIVVRPPLWATWWAYLIYMVVAVVVAYTLYRHLRHLNALHQAVAVEKQLTEYKLKFFTNISHEFRTPLTLIQGSMDKLKALPDAPASTRAPISNMQRNVDRMLRLINQLLEFRRMQNNRLSLTLEETDVVAFVHNICQGFHDTAEQKHVSLSFLPSVKTYQTCIDRGFIDKAVYNLLSNAFKYTPKEGSIIVKIKQRTEDAILAIQVIDTGVGVPEDMREKIFDRFQRGQIGRDSLGIGLDLTAELIRTHHGTIRCEENPGGGSIFTIELPTDKSVYEEKDFLSVKAPHRENQTDERQGFSEAVHETQVEPMNDHRVLVVEDDAEIQAFLKHELGRYFQVDTASDGEEALEKMKNEELIITDVLMPRMNGYELLRHIRKDERTRHLPVVMLTALDAEDQQAKGLDAGADAYVTKPFSIQLLLLQCRNLLQRSDRMKDAYASASAEPAKRVAPEIITEERDHKLLAQLSMWVDSHLASPELSVDKFAEDMGYGRTTFFAKLKALTGQTPNEFIKERRLQRAAELLKDDHVTVAEVAYQVGMGTPQYLSTTFKKRFGVTPSQYQKGK